MVKIFFPCLDLTAFSRKCTKLYQNDHNGTIFDRLLVYSGLSIICTDLSSTSDGSESEHYHLMSRAFSQHVLKSVDVMPAILAASWDGIEALMSAVSAGSIFEGPMMHPKLMKLLLGICLS